MKIFFLLYSLFFFSCGVTYFHDWRDEFFKKEVYKITKSEKIYRYRNNEYKIDRSDSSFQTFDENNILISNNHTSFCRYDSTGKLIEEKHCMRTCDTPSSEEYFYDSTGKLIKKTFSFGTHVKPNIDIYKYNSSGLLIYRGDPDDSLAISESFTYYKNKNIRSRTERHFNTNINDWTIFVDSMYYDGKNNLIRKETRHPNEDLLKITYYTYSEKNERVKLIDTTITSIETYKYPENQDVIHHAYYGREDFKYDSEGREIERIMYQPDYKTPHQKIITEYIRTIINK